MFLLSLKFDHLLPLPEETSDMLFQYKMSHAHTHPLLKIRLHSLPGFNYVGLGLGILKASQIILILSPDREPLD